MRLNIKRIMWVLVIILFGFLIRIAFEYLFDIFEDQYTITQFTDLFVRFFIVGIAILIFMSIVGTSDNTINKLPWLIVLTLEPTIGLFFFLTFGRSFRKSERYRELPLLKDGKYLVKEPHTNFNEQAYLDLDSEVTDIYKAAYNLTKHHAYINDSRVHVLTNGKEKFPVLIRELKKAQEFIVMQYYILRTDKIGKEVLNILKEKAEEGLDVYLMYDAFGGVFLNRKLMKSLKKSGVKIVINDPVHFGLFNTRINFRNHRKVIVIDSRVGFIGGLNLGDEYLSTKHKKTGFWRDTHLMIEGKAVNSLTQLFFRDWYYNTDKFISDDKYYKAKKFNDVGITQIIPSGPDFKHPPIRNVYVKMINNAKKSIKIMTPYIALDQELLTSLVIAAKSGVKVDIIIPGKPDKKSIYTVTKSFIEDLLEEDINVYTYTKGFTHAKVFIIDDFLASCGTFNLDNRSAKINFEVTALIYNEAVEKLVYDFDEDLKECKKIELKKWRKRGIITRIYEGMFNLFSPLV